MKNKAGFTLIELLVVVAIISLLMSVISISVGSSRARARDARRISDARQIQNAMNLYYNQGGGYPPESDWVVNASLSCNSSFIMRIPGDPVASTPYDYQVTGTGITGCGTTVYPRWYSSFTTEQESEIGPPGTYYASADGISAIQPFAP